MGTRAQFYVHSVNITLLRGAFLRRLILLLGVMVTSTGFSQWQFFLFLKPLQ